MLLLLLAAPLTALAQGTGKISGIVTDNAGDPLPGANVVIDGTTLGAATNIDGEYVILGVPIGTYNVTASFVGFASVTIEGAEVNSGFTRILDFELGSNDIMDEIVVEYERPLIQNDAIGAPTVVSGEEIENLPVRGVGAVTALQTGVVSEADSDDLFIRGGRGEEVVYFVDGVKVTSSARLNVNQQAIAEQEMLLGTIPARYGDVQSGVVSITTKSGGVDYFGSLELITSEVLDNYGFNTGTISLGGPLVPSPGAADKASFFLSVGGLTQTDQNPYGRDFVELSDAAFDQLLAAPQLFEVVNEDGTSRFIPVPDAVVAGTAGQDILDNPAAFGIELGEGETLLQETGTTFPRIIDATETITGDQYERVDTKDNPFRSLTVDGNLTFNPVNSATVRLGGNFNQDYDESYSYASGFFNRNRFFIRETDSWRVFGNYRQRLGDAAFFQVQGEFSSFETVLFPNGFSGDVEDMLRYGDISDPVNEVAARYIRFEGGVATPPLDGNFGSVVGDSYGLFNNPGNVAAYDTYDRRDETRLRFSGFGTAQLGVHQIEFGGEFETETRRRFRFTNGSRLAQFVNDPNDPFAPGAEGLTEGGASAYDELGFSDFSQRGPTLYYGYSFNGLREVDDQNVANFFDTAYEGDDKYDIAPHKPLYYGGYISDKIEFRDLVLQLGLRVDVFDNNTVVPLDLYAPFPIVRAGNGVLTDPNEDLFQGDGFQRPGNIDDDFAVYFGDDGGIVAYRDLEGNFFDENGTSINSNDIGDLVFNVGGQTSSLGGTTPELVDYEAQVTVMPRVGVSFPVTDRALFFASYNVTSQRPTVGSFASLNRYIDLESAFINNPNLKPERTTQYELGFRQRLGERAALTISGFYRTQENKINVREVQFSELGYFTYLNTDFTTTKGMELGFDLRRTNNLALDVNYTLSFAQGTGSSGLSSFTAAFRDGIIPETIFPLDFDRRHVFTASIDYRLGNDEGPQVLGASILENFGVNLLAQVQSGQPFTSREIRDAPLTSDINVGDVIGSPNSVTMPTTAELNLKVNRVFDLGFGGAQLNAYFWILNLLDQEIIANVYRTTGQPDEDGFGSYDAFQGTATRVAGVPDFLYDEAYIASPVIVARDEFTSAAAGSRFYGQPRRFRLGLLFSF
ncbi:MAG: TonB-dependent receptor [Bacteroidota bacterium]